MDLSKLTKGGQIFVGASLVYLIASFLPWYTIDVQGYGSQSFNAWGDIGFLWGSLWALALLALAVIHALPAFGVAGPKIPAVANLAVAALATLFGLLKLLIGEDTYFGNDISASFGLFLAIIAAAGATFGGFLLFKESGGSINDLKDMNKLKGQFSGGGPGSPPPPPGGMVPPPPPHGGMNPPPPPPPPMV